MVIFVFNFVVGMGILYFTYVYYEKEEKEEKKRAEKEMIERLHQETSGIEKQIEALTLRVSEMEQKNETTEALLHRILFLLQADPATRKLHLHNTSRVDKYLKNIRYLLSSCQLLHAATKLETEFREKGWSDHLEDKYNNIDQETTNVMISSKNYCAPSTNSKFPWSTTLKETGLCYRYWNLKVRQL